MGMIPLFIPCFDDDDIQAVTDTIKSGWLIEHHRTKEFEEEFAKYVGTKYAVATTSGTAALFLALKAAGVDTRSVVAVPDFTALGSVRAVQLAGAQSVLFDVDDCGNIDVDAVCESMVSHVIVVHNNGTPCDLTRLIEHFGERNIIEDACQALGSQPDGRQTGIDTDMGCFSLSTTKIITAGQGGIVVTDDETLHVRLQRLKNQGNFRGVDPADVYPIVGYNFMWTDMQAALALSQMKKLDARVEAMWAIYKTYLYKIGNYMPVLHDGVLPWRIIVKVPPETRDDVVSHLRENGVGARAFFSPLHVHFGLDGYPNATKFAASGICLPSHPGLSNEDVAEVCRVFLEAKTILSGSGD